jgi:hypothetical protein
LVLVVVLLLLLAGAPPGAADAARVEARVCSLTFFRQGFFFKL